MRGQFKLLGLMMLVLSCAPPQVRKESFGVDIQPQPTPEPAPEPALQPISEPTQQPTSKPAPEPAPQSIVPPTRCPEQRIFPGGYVCIEPGTFMMGSPESEIGRRDSETQHRVTLTRAFYMKVTEVTQGEWQASIGNNPSHFNACGARCPVEGVSWYDAISYANLLSKKEGLERCYQDGDKDYDARSASMGRTPTWPKGVSCLGYRLPTEAEWEYAARAGTTTAFHTGAITQPNKRDPNLDKAAWYRENSGDKPHSVGEKMRNAWGLYDMHGNVEEWVWDWFEDGIESGEQRDPLGPEKGWIRVLRGGSWVFNAGGCRSATRANSGPEFRQFNRGFRLSRSVP